jgi:hypothetical protein
MVGSAFKVSSLRDAQRSGWNLYILESEVERPEIKNLPSETLLEEAEMLGVVHHFS